MEQGISYVYGLLDPELERIRYVGVSSDPIRRYNNHISPAQLSQAHQDRGVVSDKQRWIAELDKRGLRPGVVILEEVPVSPPKMGKAHPQALAAEDRWMIRLMDQGHPLTNGRLPKRGEPEDERLLREAQERGRELFPE